MTPHEEKETEKKLDFDCERYHDINDYLQLMEILRAPDGCPWDREQTHESIRQNCLEEAYEVCEAIDEGDPEHLKEELGDLLMQVIFHASIENQAGRFSFNDVCDAACRKLIYRHPHVFGDREANKGAEAAEVWDRAKQKEHGQNNTADIVNGVARALPGLWRAQKMLKKAKTGGYEPRGNFDDCAGKFSKAVQTGEELEESFGRLIFAALEATDGRIDCEKAVQDTCNAFGEKIKTYYQEDAQK